MGRADYTYLTVRNQLEAFDLDQFEVGVFDRDQDKMLPRTWSKEQVLKSVNWLKTQNAQGRDIFIRPAGSLGFVFFDDVPLGIINQMEQDGLCPALVIESSPQNFHGWIKISNEPIEPNIATAAAKLIAKKYHGDTDSADWRHYGRLSGFTNRKAKYVQEDGRQPFVKLHSRRPALAEKSALVIKAAKERVAKEARIRAERLENRPTPIFKPNSENPGTFYNRQLKALEQQYGSIK